LSKRAFFVLVIFFSVLLPTFSAAERPASSARTGGSVVLATIKSTPPIRKLAITR